MATAAPKYTVVMGGQAQGTEVDSKAFLETNPRGPYTTARTTSAWSRVFELKAHVERLATTAELMGLPAAKTKPAELRPLLLQTLQKAILYHREAHSSSSTDHELKLTILVVVRHGPSDAVLDCLCHVGPLSPIPAPPIKVEVRRASRQNARAKDSQWVRDRKHLEALITQHAVNDVVMCDEEGQLLEGTQTNFYAITSGGVLQTAGGGSVLEGTVRRLLLQVCAEEGIPVDESPPRLSESGSWQGALLSSTSRLLLPIHWMGMPEEEVKAGGGAAARSFTYEEGCLALRIVALVAARVVDASTAIFSD